MKASWYNESQTAVLAETPPTDYIRDYMAAHDLVLGDLMALRQTPFKYHPAPYGFLWIVHRYLNHHSRP